ncbi:hypothetical protein MMC27_001758 [Xylographa pallens]|nr:hypothetical protein [Xylographa pallens]
MIFRTLEECHIQADEPQRDEYIERTGPPISSTKSNKLGDIDMAAKDNNAAECITCPVSIGAGRPKKSKDDFFKPGRLNLFGRLNAVLKAAYDSDSTHEDTESFMMARELPYFRLNVEAETWKRPLSFGNTEEERAIRHSWQEDVTAELNKQYTIDHLNTCTRMLVQQRRARAQDTERWRPFSLVTSYACLLEKHQFKRSRELILHLQFDHHKYWAAKSDEEKNEYRVAMRSWSTHGSCTSVNQDPPARGDPTTKGASTIVSPVQSSTRTSPAPARPPSSRVVQAA